MHKAFSESLPSISWQMRRRKVSLLCISLLEELVCCILIPNLLCFSGMPVSSLYTKCRERFLVSSQVTLNAHLTEFKDHDLVKTRKHSDGQDCLRIPLVSDALEKLLQELAWHFALAHLFFMDDGWVHWSICSFLCPRGTEGSCPYWRKMYYHGKNSDEHAIAWIIYNSDSGTESMLHEPLCFVGLNSWARTVMGMERAWRSPAYASQTLSRIVRLSWLCL